MNYTKKAKTYLFRIINFEQKPSLKIEKQNLKTALTYPKIKTTFHCQYIRSGMGNPKPVQKKARKV